MATKRSYICDGCGREVDMPSSGELPTEWLEVRVKTYPSMATQLLGHFCSLNCVGRYAKPGVKK